MRKLLAIVLVVGLALALVGTGLTVLLGERRAPDPKPTGETAPAGLERFYDQDLRWTDCDDDRCTTVEVPVDYAEPQGQTLRLAVRRVPASGDAEAAMFVNPGGPGGSAADFVGYLAGQLPGSLRATHDVIGVDPRGIGDSTPLQCLSDEDFDAFIDTDPDPDDDAGIEGLTTSVRSMGQACEQNSGPLAAHVSTEEAARDHDVVRALMGRSKMTWFGFSYGTQLGATYADLFPDRVSRMVLDGAVDVTLDPVQTGLGQAEGFQRALESYLASCLKQDECPVGGSVDEATARIAAMMKQLSAEPLPVGDRELTEGRAFYAIAMALYSRESWPYLTRAFEGMERRDGTIMMLLSDTYFERRPNGTFANNSGQVIYAVNCLDSPDAPDRAATQAALPRFRQVSPVFGAALGWGVMACHDWPVRGDHPQQPVTAEGAPPILVVGTTRDPATPYAWSEAMASQLSSGVLLTREGDGHTAYTSGNDCVADAVNAYFEDGTVPKDGTTCPESR